MVRIIGGDLRSRRIRFEATRGLRPTPDRVRETLFNWLAPHIRGARCLDLFAGSGALGFEAASRGAASVILVESNRRACRHLEDNRLALGLGAGVSVRCESASAFLRRPAHAFDIVFLDPPFDADGIDPALDQLARGDRLAAAARVYVERRATRSKQADPPAWETVRQGVCGDVDYRLLMRTGEPAP